MSTPERQFDLAVIGSGFGGSLMAMVARRLGKTVVLLEQGSHPRFTIGESSTPLANLLLERLARDYQLENVLPLASYGAWQEKFPEIGCGLKRGFSFWGHSSGKRWEPDPDHQRQLLVAASPNDRVADTQWYRPDFDHHLLKGARSMGVEYFDQTRITSFQPSPEGGLLECLAKGKPMSIRASLVVDASGPRGCLYRLLGLRERPFPDLPPTQALYAHFTDVGRWDELHPSTKAPYPADDAAVHHVFDQGWMWMLRFNNGRVSAGIASRRDLAVSPDNKERVWEGLLDELPSVAELFREAKPATPFMYLPQLSFRVGQASGLGWVLLPSAAGFVDPLLSTGFTLNLLGISRLADVFEKRVSSDDQREALQDQASLSLAELDRAGLLISALYGYLDDFEVFTALTKLYFAAVSFAETDCRLHDSNPCRQPFLLMNHGSFGEGMLKCCRTAINLVQNKKPLVGVDRGRLLRLIRETIEPVDVAGLGRDDRHNWFPVDFDDLRQSCGKLGVTSKEVDRMLERVLGAV